MLREAIELFEKEKFEEAFPLFKNLAREGDSEAMYYLGVLYYEGWGVEPSKEEAIKWWKRAERRGSLDAKYMLQTILTTSSIFARE
ncbi:MAG: SEL1-like repeat protein [Epsilonproteobacteria bacterium]|nr:SEL1-like repeat protein [Campylobacterota bacterium]